MVYPLSELSLLLIDWSRVEPSAGGVPQVLYPILENLLAFNILEAKKIAFAQSILSGVSDSGDLGGEAMSDVAIRVKARNEAACSSLRGFIDEYNDEDSNTAKYKSKYDNNNNNNNNDSIAEKDTPLKIAVLYGSYHILDLRNRIKMLGFSEIDDARNNNYDRLNSMTVWEMSYPNIFNKSNGDLCNGVKLGGKINKGSAPVNYSQIFVSIVTVVLYLIVGALDWWSGKFLGNLYSLLPFFLYFFLSFFLYFFFLSFSSFCFHI